MWLLELFAEILEGAAYYYKHAIAKLLFSVGKAFQGASASKDI